MSSVPISTWSDSIGIEVSAGPMTAVTAARKTPAAPTPYRVERVPRVLRRASTIVSASTASTAQARNVARIRYAGLNSGQCACRREQPEQEERDGIRPVPRAARRAQHRDAHVRAHDRLTDRGGRGDRLVPAADVA